MNTTAIYPSMETLVKPFKFAASPYEYRVTALRECPTPENLQMCDTPQKAADYWRMHVASNPYFNPECECFTVLLLESPFGRGLYRASSSPPSPELLMAPSRFIAIASVS